MSDDGKRISELPSTVPADGDEMIIETNEGTRKSSLNEFGQFFVDNTLTKSGKTADAKVVGDKLLQFESSIASPYKFQGDVESISDLPNDLSETDSNTTYYVKSESCMYSWTGSEWRQSSLSESDYESLLGELRTEIQDIEDLIDPLYNDALYISDNNGYVICKIDKDGLNAVGLNSGTSDDLSAITSNPYKDKKLVSIGDSLSTGGKWQQWLVEWLGCTFDKTENSNGDGTNPALSVGGSAIYPKVESSIYIRSLSIANYNPDIIVIFAGQNDGAFFYMGGNSIYEGVLGTINDVPYRKTVVFSEVPQEEWEEYTCQSGTGATEGAPTIYASAMGMIENIMESCPQAIIRCLTPMYMWCEVPNSSGYTTEQPPYREPLVKMWKEICNKYHIQIVNMWDESGVNKFNAPSYYNGVFNVHFNDFGYKRVAECVYKTM